MTLKDSVEMLQVYQKPCSSESTKDETKGACIAHSATGAEVVIATEKLIFSFRPVPVA